MQPSRLKRSQSSNNGSDVNTEDQMFYMIHVNQGYVLRQVGPNPLGGTYGTRNAIRIGRCIAIRFVSSLDTYLPTYQPTYLPTTHASSKGCCLPKVNLAFGVWHFGGCHHFCYVIINKINVCNLLSLFIYLYICILAN